MTNPVAMPATPANPHDLWQAVLDRNARLDGVVFYGVRSTHVYCRPSCPSRRPRREQVRFFFDPKSAESEGYRPCRRCRPTADRLQDPDLRLAQQICRFVEENLDGTLTMTVLEAGLKVSARRLQAVFKKVLGISIHQYIEARRFALFKLGLRFGRSVADATYEAGYNSSSRVYEGVSKRLGMTPAVYGKGGQAVRIRYAVVESEIGNVLIAATDKGVCKISMGDAAEKLASDLAGEFPRAEIVRDQDGLGEFMSQVLEHIRGNEPRLELPLDIRATAFQQRVYKELRRIPYGATRSYSQIAQAIGSPTASRAVARACASNPVALAIPCHRVVGSSGEISGYRWGRDRKKHLLETEAQHTQEARS